MIVIPRVSIQSSSMGTSGISNLSSSIVLFITETGDSDREVKESKTHPIQYNCRTRGQKRHKMSLAVTTIVVFFFWKKISLRYKIIDFMLMKSKSAPSYRGAYHSLVIENLNKPWIRRIYKHDRLNQLHVKSLHYKHVTQGLKPSISKNRKKKWFIRRQAGRQLSFTQIFLTCMTQD